MRIEQKSVESCGRCLGPANLPFHELFFLSFPLISFKLAFQLILNLLLFWMVGFMWDDIPGIGQVKLSFSCIIV